MTDERGYLVLDGWHGRTRTLVKIVSRTPRRVMIQAIERTRLAGRYRWLEPGEAAIVPAHAVHGVACEEQP